MAEPVPAPSGVGLADAVETVVVPAVFGSLNRYLEASRAQAVTCLADLGGPTRLPGKDTSLRFHYVKFDADGTPQFRKLAAVLVRHVVRYCMSCRTREDHKLTIEDVKDGDLFLMARDMFRKVNTSGEVGELLLFFILEAVLGLPQVIAKMELKLNANDEVKGADGIHLGWDEAKREAIFYLGEAKLYTRFPDAVSSVLTSISELNDNNGRDRELRLMTAHFKHLDPALKRAVFEAAAGKSGVGARFVHACFIGFDSKLYAKLAENPRVFAEKFTGEYQTAITRIVAAVDQKLAGFKYQHLAFEFILLPFVSVQDFRKAFYAELTGVSS